MEQASASQQAWVPPALHVPPGSDAGAGCCGGEWRRESEGRRGGLMQVRGAVVVRERENQGGGGDWLMLVRGTT